MSWSAYTAKLVNEKKCDKAAIIGLNGTVFGATGVEVSAAEAAAIAKAFADPNGARMNGVTIGGTKYICFNADDQQVQLKKGKGGACAAKAKTLCVLALWTEENPNAITNQSALAEVSKFANALASKGL